MLAACAAAALGVAGWSTAADRAAGDRATLTLLSFSDYHSHAMPFRWRGRAAQAGIARGLLFLRKARRRPGTLVVSGGDMLNQGTPSWSDEYGCVEWPWLDGTLDAMALGNHDLDYGAAAFEECRRGVRFPVLAANLVRADGTPHLAVDGRAYVVKEAGGVRIGIFAVAGPEMQRLVRSADLPAGTRFSDATSATRDVVDVLRRVERANAVVLIGHQSRAEDEALARDVPGIDLILGSHSHAASELATLPGTATRYLAPEPYLASVAEARLEFAAGRLQNVEGRLIPMDESRAADPAVAARVHQLHAELQRRRPERFERVGHALTELSDAGVRDGPCPLGDWATEALRAAAGAHAAFVSASSFRRALAPGPVTREDLHAALPYPNEIVAARLTGRALLDVLATSLARRGSDAHSQQSGLRFELKDGAPHDVRVLRDPHRPAAGHEPVLPDRHYRVATTDFQAGFLEDYRRIFTPAGAAPIGLDVHGVLLEVLARGPVAARVP